LSFTGRLTVPASGVLDPHQTPPVLAAPTPSPEDAPLLREAAGDSARDGESIGVFTSTRTD